MATEEDPIFFFPIGRFTSFTNVLSATIFTYKANKTKVLNTILKILNLSTSKYPECIEVTMKSRNSKNIKLFYLTRILAILILLEYENCDCNEDDEEKIKLFSIFLKVIHRRSSIEDPISALDKLIVSTGNTIDKLITLLSIMIEFSDYDNDSVLKFIYSFNYNFLRLINLDNSPDCYLYLRKNNDEDIQISESKGIEIYDVHSTLNTDSKKYSFIKKKLSNEKENEIPYACINYGNNTLYLSLISQDGEYFTSEIKCDTSTNIDDADIIADYEMYLPSNDSQNDSLDPLNFLAKDVISFKKTIDSEDDEKKAEFSHFYYFTQKMDFLYDQIKTISDSLDHKKDPISELYSIVYNISIFNYHIAKESKLEFEQENEDIEETSFITEFLTWENYLLLLIENIDQNFTKTNPSNIVRYVAKIYNIYNNVLENKYSKSDDDGDKNKDKKKKRKKDDDDDDDEGEEEDDDKNKKKDSIIEENKKIVDQMIKFTLILLLSVSKELIKASNVNETDMHKIFVVILQDHVPKGTTKDEWIEKFLGIPISEDQRQMARTNLSTFIYDQAIFKNDHKIGTMMRNFYMKSIDLIKREYHRFADILNDVNKYGLKIRSMKDATKYSKKR